MSPGSVMLFAASVLALSFAANPAAAGFVEGEAAYSSKDYESAYAEFRKAADQGHAGVRYHLGMMYRLGQGVRTDPVEAVRYWRPGSGN